MADAYRGLTIKIGADATQLDKELQRVKSAANSAQKDLRKLDKALHLDPGNVGLMDKRLDALGASARSSAEKIRMLQRALNGVYAGSLKGAPTKTFRDLDAQLKKSGESAASYAARMRAEFNKVNSAITQFRAKILQAEGISTNNKSEGMIREDYEKLIKNADVAKKYAAQIQRIDELGRQSVNWNDKLIDANELASIKKAEVDLEAERAALKDVGASFAVAKQERDKFANQTGITEAANQVKEYSESANRAKQRVTELDRAMAQQPATPGLAAERYQAVQYALEEDNKQLASLRDKMATLKDAGAESINASLAELERREKAAGEAAAQAGVKFREQQANMQGLKDEYRSLLSQQHEHITGASIMSDSDLAKNKADLEAVKNSIRETRAEITKTGDAAKAAQAKYNTASATRDLKETDMAYKTLSASAAAYSSKMTKSTKDWTKGAYMMRSIGTSLYSTITPAATMAAYGIVNSTDQIDAAYRDMRKTVDGTDQQFETLKKSAMDFSKTHVTSADQILEIQAIGGQLGVATDDLGKFSETVSNIDVATNINAEDAAEDLGKLGSVTKMTSDDYEHFGDSLVRLGNKFPGQESDIMDITTRFAGMAQTVGMSRTDMLAWATAATATGQKSEAAGSAMQRFIGYLESSVSSYETNTAKGKKATNDFADISGKSAKKFAEEWKSSPTAAMKDVLKGLVDLKKEGGSVDGWLQEHMSKNVRDRQLIEGLVNSYGKYTDAQGKTTKGFTILDRALDESADAWKNGGDANAEATKKAEGFSGQLSILKNKAQVFASEMGDSLAPALNTANGAIDVLTKGYSNLGASGKNIINMAGGLAIAAGPVLTTLGTMGQGISSLKRGLDNSTVSFLQSARGQKVFTAATKNLNVETKNFNTVSKLQQSSLGNNGLAMKKASGIAKGLTAANKAATGGLVGLAVAGVTFLGLKLVDLKQHADDYAAVQKGLISAQNDATSSAQSTGDTYKDMRGDVDQTTSALAQMRQEFVQQWSNYETSAGVVDQYVSTIDKLAGKGNLTAVEQQQLQSAVEGYNNATGSSISITDQLNGTLSDSVENIDKQAEAWKRNAKAQVYSQQLQDMTKKQVEAQQQYNDAYLQWQQEVNKLNSTSPNDPKFDEYARNVDLAADAMNKAKTNLNAVNQGITVQTSQLAATNQGLDAYVEDNEKLFSGVAGGKAAFSSLATYIAQMNVSQDQLKKGGSDLASQLVSSYNAIAGTGANVNYVIASLSQLGVAQTTLANMTPEQAATFGNAYNSMVANGQNIEGLKTSIQQLGVTQAQVAALTPDTVAQMMNSYNGSAQSIDGIIGKLSQLKGIAVDPTKVTVEATDNGTIAHVEGLIIDLDHKRINGKKFDVTSNGTIKTEKDHVIDLNNMKIDGKSFHVTSNGTIKDEKDKVIDLDKKNVKDKKFNVEAKGSKKAKDDIDKLDKSTKKKSKKDVEVKSKGADKAKKDLDSVDKSTKPKTKIVTAKEKGADSVKRKLDDVDKSASKSSTKQVNFTESGYSSVKSKISELSGSSTIGTKKIVFEYETRGKKPAGAATGGISRLSDILYGAVKAPQAYRYARSHNMIANAHADGGIVNTPTFTRAGWVGENGAEAIIPLDNKRYVKPFAQAVASQMQASGGGGGTTIVNNYTIDGLQVAPESALAAAMDKVFSESERLERM